jgi:TetR/AcrR family transcriptional repressor of nem operon
MVARNPDATRQKILEAAAAEIHRHGFRNASVDQILAETGLTKGALYHHFATKADLALAVVDEVIASWILSRWVEPMERAENPIDGLVEALDHLSPEEVETVCECGCPLNNLAQEMSAVDETFRKKLASLYGTWKDRMSDALLRGQGAGFVASDLDCRKAAAFIAAAVEGAAGAAKNAHDPAILAACRDGLIRYLESLRAPALVTAR